jgi:manganese/zinc/iron transport system substrate-binding protein
MLQQRGKMNYFIILVSLLTVFINPVLADRTAKGDKVVSTTGMINSIAKEMVPDQVTAEAIMGSGTDPHLFKPSRSDIVKFMSAKIILYNGNHLEGRMLDAFNRFQTQGITVIPITEKIGDDKLIQSSNFSGNFDPHVWMDPKLWYACAEVVKHQRHGVVECGRYTAGQSVLALCCKYSWFSH